jgi:hypothetical protein
MSRAQWQRGQRHQQHEDQCEAARAEQLGDVAEGLRLIAAQPLLELVTDRCGERAAHSAT